jgi:hypothetical protein
VVNVSERKLVKKLTEVMQEVKYIQKRGKNSFHNYTYATESDVAEKIRESLSERCVMMIPNIIESTYREHVNNKGKTEYITKVRMEFKFIDGETGEELIFHSEGEGQDAGDKGIYKAITGAQKYALMKVFMIPTGDDPEADNGVDERNTQSNDNQPKQQQNNQQEKPQKVAMITQKQIAEMKVYAMKLGKLMGKSDVEAVASFMVNKTFDWKQIESYSKAVADKLIEKLIQWVAETEANLTIAN